MRAPAKVLLLAALLVAPLGDATTALAQGDSRVGLATSLADTLAAGAKGSTTLGVNATSATTSVNLGTGATGFSSLLVLHSASASSQQAYLRVRTSADAGTVAGATITLNGVTQVVVLNGNATQASGAAVALPAGGNLTLAATGMSAARKSDVGSLVIDVIVGPSATAAVVEGWTLRWT